MFVPWQPADGVDALRARIEERVARYRTEYTDYYRAHAQPDSPPQRDTNPSVVVISGLGVFGFAKDKREARITTEFFLNAIHVMAGANALEVRLKPDPTMLPQARHAEQAGGFTSFHNYVALPRSEAFRIEYWALEVAKLQRGLTSWQRTSARPQPQRPRLKQPRRHRRSTCPPLRRTLRHATRSAPQYELPCCSLAASTFW